jgi:hypothetical protein
MTMARVMESSIWMQNSAQIGVLAGINTRHCKNTGGRYLFEEFIICASRLGTVFGWRNLSLLKSRDLDMCGGE